MARDLGAGRAIEETSGQAVVRLEKAGFRIDYIAVRDSETLMPIETAVVETPARLLAAVFLGRVRLIDNVAVIPAAEN